MSYNLKFNDLSTELKIREVKERFFGNIDLRFVGNKGDINLFRIYDSGDMWGNSCYHSLYIVYSDTGVFGKLGTPCFEVVYIDNINNLSRCKKLTCGKSDRKSILSFINKLDIHYPNRWNRISSQIINSTTIIGPKEDLSLSNGDLEIKATALKILSIEEKEDGAFKYNIVTETLDIYNKNFIGYNEVLNKIYEYRAHRLEN